MSRTIEVFDSRVAVLDSTGMVLCTFAVPDRDNLAIELVAFPGLLEVCKRIRRRVVTGKPLQVGDVEALVAAIAKATTDNDTEPKGEE